MKIAANVKKLTRDQAYLAVCDLKQGRVLPPGQIDGLLMYFAPKPSGRPKTAFEWVAKAAGINDNRPQLHHVHVKSGVACASDGHRMHWASVDLPDGAYQPGTGAQVIDAATAPDFERLKPNLTAGEFLAVSALQHGVVCPGAGRKEVHYRAPEGTEWAVNSKYLSDAVAQDETCCVAFEDWSGSHRIYGESKFGRFVIMGMRV